MLAAYRGHAETVNTLIYAGANVNIIDEVSLRIQNVLVNIYSNYTAEQ